MIKTLVTSAKGRQFQRSHHFAPLVWIIAAIIVANLPALLHLVTTNPLVLNAYLTPPTSGLLPGLPYIDPNAGYTLQALGHLAALDWLHGHIPWWNPFEGMGSPLAGEMQSGAFFPPTLLLVWHEGSLLLQLFLETLTGWSTYFLVRRLGVGRSFSTAAGIAFGLCGTFAWLAHAPIRPIALLPLCLLGVERAIDSANEQKRGGWHLLAIAVALSVLAGFPESTLINGLFVAWWSLARIAGTRRRRWRSTIVKLGGGAAIGIALSAPLAVAFLDYLPHADIGPVNGSFALVSIQPYDLVHLILPYSLGPLFAFTAPIHASFSLGPGTSGYLTVTVIAAGLVGLFGKRQRSLRMGLGAWILVCLLRTFGFPPVVHAMAVIPGVRQTAFYLWADPSWELAAVILAALGLDDTARRLTPPRGIAIAAVATILAAGWAAVTAWPLLTAALSASGVDAANRHLYAFGSLGGACILLAVLVVGGFLASHGPAAGTGRRLQDRRLDRRRRCGRLVMAGVVGIESILLLGFTYLSAPRPTTLEMGSVSWLQAHLGSYRFFTLGPIQPDYGSYFGIAEANINDLPVPSTWNTYITRHLDANALPESFTGLARLNPSGPTPAQELTANLANYEAAGVRYVVEAASGLDSQGQPFPARGSPRWPLGPRLVYRDKLADIWQLPAAAPIFSLTPSPRAVGNDDGGSHSGPNTPCTTTEAGSDMVTVRCSRPSVLVRRVQYLPGWSATGSGISLPVVEDRSGPPGLFQEVHVPPGTTTLRFNYLPPHELAAFAAVALALIILLGSLVLQWTRRIRPRPMGSPMGVTASAHDSTSQRS